MISEDASAARDVSSCSGVVAVGVRPQKCSFAGFSTEAGCFSGSLWAALSGMLRGCVSSVVRVWEE